jgi:PHD/YefM family antitoxin component YafN of YafNO toxin-antitoxin module
MNRCKPSWKIGGAKLTSLEAIVICNSMSKVTYTVSEAQANLPGLCRAGRRFVISRRDKPVYVAMPLEDYDALLETMELLSDPTAMKTLRAAKAGKLAYKELNLADENFGL